MAIYHTAHLECTPQTLEDFRTRLHRHAAQSLSSELGCLRFDVYQSTEQPTVFLLVEAYADEAALRSHQASAHVQSFRKDTQNWVVKRTWWFWTASQIQDVPGSRQVSG